MLQKEVSAQVPEKKDGEGKVTQVALGPVAVQVPFPGTFEEALGWCSEEAMLTNAFAHYRVSPVQSTIRALLKAGKSDQEIQAECAKLVMGVARVGAVVDTKAAYIAMFAGSTPEDQAKMLKDLREQAKK